MPIGNLRACCGTKCCVIAQRCAGERVFPDQLPECIEGEILRVSRIRREPEAQDGGPVVSLASRVLDDRLELGAFAHHDAIDRLNGDEFFVDHGGTREVGRVREVVGVGLGRVELGDLLPVVRDQLELVAIEFDGSVTHPFDVASKPLSRQQADPVLVVPKLEHVGGGEPHPVFCHDDLGLGSGFVLVKSSVDLRLCLGGRAGHQAGQHRCDAHDSPVPCARLDPVFHGPPYTGT